jgi:hypothetical protein
MKLLNKLREAVSPTEEGLILYVGVLIEPWLTEPADPQYKRQKVRMVGNEDFLTNAETVTFPTASEWWGLAANMSFYEDPTNPTEDTVADGTIDNPHPVGMGCRISFVAGNLIICGLAARRLAKRL